jgi:ATP-dependent Clp protease adaptor protein ClpS
LGNTELNEDIKTKEKTLEPDMKKVIIHNDDYTPLEFVVQILNEVFNLSEQQSVKIAYDVHKKDKGIVGVYPIDIAETLVDLAQKIIKSSRQPLLITLEDN